MAQAFNLTAQLNLRGPSNVKKIVADIRRDLGTINANVQFRLDPTAVRNTSALNSALRNLNTTLGSTTTNATNAARAIRSFGSAINSVNIKNVPQQINATVASINKLNSTAANSGNSLAGATTEMQEFGKQAYLAVRRFAAFTGVTSVIFGVTNAITSGIQAFIEYDKQFVKLQQVTGQSAAGLKGLSDTITGLSTGLGVASSDITEVASTLAQAGLSARDTEKALKALALSSLTPSFDDMNQTVEGSIALMRQFGISAGDLEKALGSVNSVAAQFAVESSDIITAIQRTGGVFAAASKGVSEGTDALNEFISVFTSVRATTRESAETIATGLRTIFTRLQRGATINALKQFGVDLTDAEGKFVGAYKAVELLSSGLSKLDPRDLKFSQIVEELGGFRQIGKVIPLIQQFTTAQEALKVAQRGQGSLALDAAKAQESLANKITKVKEEFFALFREIGNSKGFQTMIRGALDLTSAMIKVADSIKGIIPVLGVLGAFKGASALTQFTAGFIGGFGKKQKVNSGGYIKKFARGGVVPGVGDGDTVPAMLEPGEFVIRKKAVQAIGMNRLHRMNKYAGGGKVSIKKLSESSKGGSFIKKAQRDNSDIIQYADEVFATEKRQKISLSEADKKYLFKQSLNPNRFKPGEKRFKGSIENLNKNVWGTAFENLMTKRLGKQWKTTSSNKDYGGSYPLDLYSSDGDFAEVKFTDRPVSYQHILSKKLRHKLLQPKNTWKFTQKRDAGPRAIDLGEALVYETDEVEKRKFIEQFKAGQLEAKRSRQKFAVGGSVQRRVGYIDYDVIANEANKNIVEAGMKSSGTTGPRLYADYLTQLAVRSRKANSLNKLSAVYGVAGSGKTTLARGQGTDKGKLRQTERFPILSPEDVSKATEVLILSSSVSKSKMDDYLSSVDRAYTLSSTTSAERERVRSQRSARDTTGVGLEGRKPGTTTGVSADTAVGEALLGDALGKKSVVLGRSTSGRLRRKKGNELVETIKKKIGFTWGSFSPMTAGHESIMDAAAAMGIPPEDFLYLVGSNEGIKSGDPSSYRTAVFDQDFRVMLAKAGAGTRGARVLPKPRDFEVPQAFDITDPGSGRRKVLLPQKGSKAFVADKTAEQTEKYKAAGYGVANIERTGGISGTMVRDLILSGQTGKLKEVLSPGVYGIILKNLSKLQNRSNVLPEIISESQKTEAVSLQDIDKEIDKLGIKRIDTKRAQTDPEYATQVEALQELRAKKQKIKSIGSFRPYEILARLAQAEPDKYALDFTDVQRKNLGGFIQKLSVGGFAEVASKGRSELLGLASKYGIAKPVNIYDILGKRASSKTPLSSLESATKQSFIQSIVDAMSSEQQSAAVDSAIAQNRKIAVVGISGERSSSEVKTVGATDKETGASVRAVPATLQTGSLPPGVAKRVQALIRNNVERLVNDVGRQIAKAAGTSIQPNRKTLRNIAGKDLEDIAGSIFEKGLGLASGNYDPSSSSIDFLGGLSSPVASLLGVDPGVMTDVTNMASMDNAKRKVTKGQFDRGRLEARKKLGRSQFAEGGLVQRFKLGGSVYDLQKGSGLSNPEFNELVKFANTNDFSMDEFKTYLAQSIQRKKNKAGLRMNPASLLSAITPETPRATANQLALANMLKGPVDAKFNPKYDNSIKYAVGGSVEDTVPALLTPGEFVINKKAAQRIGSARLHTLNRADKIQGFNKGGVVQRFAKGGTPEKMAEAVGSFDPVSAKTEKALEAAVEQLMDKIIKDIIAINPSVGFDTAYAQAKDQVTQADFTTMRAAETGDQKAANSVADAQRKQALAIAKQIRSIDNSISMQEALSAAERQVADAWGGLYRRTKTAEQSSSLLSRAMDNTRAAMNKAQMAMSKLDQSGFSRGMRGVVGGNVGFYGSMAVGMLAGQGESFFGKKDANINNASRVAAFEAGTSTVATGLATASSLTAIPGVGPFIAAMVLGVTAIKAWTDGVKAATEAALEFALRESNRKAENSAEALGKALDNLSKDVNNVDLQNLVKTRLQENIKDNSEVFNDQFADTRNKVIERTKSERTLMEWAGESSFIAPLLGYGDTTFKPESINSFSLTGKDYETMAKDMAPKYQEANRAAMMSIERALRSGVALSGQEGKDLATAPEYANERMAIIGSDRQALEKILPLMAREEELRKSGNEAAADEVKANREAIISEMIKNNASIQAAKKSIELAKAMEEANRAGRQLALSFNQLYDTIGQSINRIQFESKARQQAAQSSVNALRGNASIEQLDSKAINVLENPLAYKNDPKAFREAADSAANMLGGKQGQMLRGAAIASVELPDKMTNAIAQELKGNAGLSPEEAAKIAITKGTEEIKSLNLPPEITNQLIKQLEGNIKSSQQQLSKDMEESGGNPQEALDKFIESIRDTSKSLGEIGARAVSESAALLKERQRAFNQFIENVQEAAKAAKLAENYFKSADKIRYRGKMDLREAQTGVGESFEEAKARFDQEVGDLTGGITDPTAIRQNIQNLEQQRQQQQEDLKKANDAGDVDEAKKLTTNLTATNTALNNNREALDKLADSAELAQKALDEVKNIKGLQQGREDFVNKLLTGTPEEMENLNKAMIRLQRNLSGGLNNPDNQRDARKAFNETLRRTGSVREASKAGNTVLANQRKETLGLMQDPGFRAMLTLNMKNQGMSDQQIDQRFRQQEATLMRQMAVESGMSRNPMVQQAIAAKLDPNADPAMKRAAEQFLQTVGLQAKATEEQGRLELANAQRLLTTATDDLNLSIKNLTDTINANMGLDGKVANAKQNAAGQEMVALNFGLPRPSQPMRASKGALVDFSPRGSDTVPAMLTPGEFVVNARSTAQHLPLLKSINSGSNIVPTIMRKGGLVYLSRGGWLANSLRKDKTLDQDQTFFDQRVTEANQAYLTGGGKEALKQQLDAAESAAGNADREYSFLSSDATTPEQAANDYVMNQDRIEWLNMSPEERQAKVAPFMDQARSAFNTKQTWRYGADPDNLGAGALSQEQIDKNIQDRREQSIKASNQAYSLRKQYEEREAKGMDYRTPSQQLEADKLSVRRSLEEDRQIATGEKTLTPEDMEVRRAASGRADGIATEEQVDSYIRQRRDQAEAAAKAADTEMGARRLNNTRELVDQRFNFAFNQGMGKTYTTRDGATYIADPTGMFRDKSGKKIDGSIRAEQIYKDPSDINKYESSAYNLEAMRFGNEGPYKNIGYSERRTTRPISIDGIPGAEEVTTTSAMNLSLSPASPIARNEAAINAHMEEARPIVRAMNTPMTDRDRRRLASSMRSQGASNEQINQTLATIPVMRGPRNMAEVGMYREGVARGMTIDEIAFERQQAYLNRYNPKIREGLENELLSSGTLREPSQRQRASILEIIQQIQSVLDSGQNTSSYSDAQLQNALRILMSIVAAKAERNRIWGIDSLKSDTVYASTGKLIDFAPKGTDTVPAMLTPGEFVVNARSTAQHLPLLKAINSGSDAMVSKTMSKGGVVYLASGGQPKKEEQVANNGVSPADQQELVRLQNERIAADQEQMFITNGAMVDTSARQWTEEQFGSKWSSMTEEQQNAETQKNLPRFQQLDQDYTARRDAYVAEKGKADEATGLWSSDRFTSEHRLSFFRQERDRSQAAYAAASQAEYDQQTKMREASKDEKSSTTMPPTADGSRPATMPQYAPTSSSESATALSRTSIASRDAARRSLANIPQAQRTPDQQNRYLQLKYEDDLAKGRISSSITADQFVEQEKQKQYARDDKRFDVLSKKDPDSLSQADSDFLFDYETQQRDRRKAVIAEVKQREEAFGKTLSDAERAAENNTKTLDRAKTTAEAYKTSVQYGIDQKNLSKIEEQRQTAQFENFLSTNMEAGIKDTAALGKFWAEQQEGVVKQEEKDRLALKYEKDASEFIKKNTDAKTGEFNEEFKQQRQAQKDEAKKRDTTVAALINEDFGQQLGAAQKDINDKVFTFVDPVDSRLSEDNITQIKNQAAAYRQAADNLAGIKNVDSTKTIEEYRNQAAKLEERAASFTSSTKTQAALDQTKGSIVRSNESLASTVRQNTLNAAMADKSIDKYASDKDAAAKAEAQAAAAQQAAEQKAAQAKADAEKRQAEQAAAQQAKVAQEAKAKQDSLWINSSNPLTAGLGYLGGLGQATGEMAYGAANVVAGAATVAASPVIGYFAGNSAEEVARGEKLAAQTRAIQEKQAAMGVLGPQGSDQNAALAQAQASDYKGESSTAAAASVGLNAMAQGAYTAVEAAQAVAGQGPIMTGDKTWLHQGDDERVQQAGPYGGATRFFQNTGYVASQLAPAVAGLTNPAPGAGILEKSARAFSALDNLATSPGTVTSFAGKALGSIGNRVTGGRLSSFTAPVSDMLSSGLGFIRGKAAKGVKSMADTDFGKDMIGTFNAVKDSVFLRGPARADIDVAYGNIGSIDDYFDSARKSIAGGKLSPEAAMKYHRKEILEKAMKMREADMAKAKMYSQLTGGDPTKVSEVLRSQKGIRGLGTKEDPFTVPPRSGQVVSDSSTKAQLDSMRQPGGVNYNPPTGTVGDPFFATGKVDSVASSTNPTRSSAKTSSDDLVDPLQANAARARAKEAAESAETQKKATRAAESAKTAKKEAEQRAESIAKQKSLDEQRIKAEQLKQQQASEAKQRAEAATKQKQIEEAQLKQAQENKLKQQQEASAAKAKEQAQINASSSSPKQENRTRESLISQLSEKQATIYDIVGAKAGQSISPDDVRTLQRQGSKWLHPDLPSNRELDPSLQTKLNKIIELASDPAALERYNLGLKMGYTHDDLMEAWIRGTKFSKKTLKRRRPDINPSPAAKMNKGGIVYANNGALIAARQGTDTVPAMLTPGEFVVNRQAAQQHMPVLNAINNGYYNRGGIVQYLANGGLVSPPKYYQEGGQVTNTGSANSGVSTDIGNAINAAMAGLSNIVGQISQVKEVASMFNEAIGNFGSIGQTVVDGMTGASSNLAQVGTELNQFAPEVKFTGRVETDHRFNGLEAANNVLNTLGPTMAENTKNQMNNAFQRVNKGVGNLDAGVFGPDSSKIMGMA
jgi:hypothetical protein